VEKKKKEEKKRGKKKNRRAPNIEPTLVIHKPKEDVELLNADVLRQQKSSTVRVPTLTNGKDHQL